jgi:hypothetical protein
VLKWGGAELSGGGLAAVTAGGGRQVAGGRRKAARSAVAQKVSDGVNGGRGRWRSR